MNIFDLLIMLFWTCFIAFSIYVCSKNIHSLIKAYIELKKEINKK